MKNNTFILMGQHIILDFGTHRMIGPRREKTCLPVFANNKGAD